jgi:CHASE2 domain-containing sensor protein
MRKFWVDCILATLFVFVFMWGIFQVTQLNVFNAFDSIGKALNDVELTDYVFSELRDDPLVDTSIVVVNIGNLTRRQIAQQIQIVSKYKPRVIGFDGFFDCRTGLRDTVNCPALKDTLGNLMLSEAIKEAGNVVLVTKLFQNDSTLVERGFEDVADSLRRSDPIFRDYALAEGFATLDTDAAFQDDVKTCRSFTPQWYYDNKKIYAFSVQLAMAYDSVRTKAFLDRGNFREVISYRGNVFDIFGTTNYPQMFYTLDVEEVMTENFTEEVIKDRIVIFGYLGQQLGDPSWSDKFYTPLNNKMAGKSNPDMFGVVVHANIVSMILHADYIDEMAEWQQYLMAFMICLLNVALFSLINAKLPTWYDGITKSLQLLQLVLYSFLMVMIFHEFSYKLNITYTLAAVALVGDVFEIYNNIFKAIFIRITTRLGFTKSADQVLTS